MRDGLKQLHAEAAGLAAVVADREHVGKIKGQRAVVNMQLFSQPMRGVQQFQQVAVPVSLNIGGDDLHQGCACEIASADFNNVNIIEVGINIFRADER